VAGQLAVRAGAARHQGDFRAIVESLNQTLDAVARPLDEAGRTLDAIARGVIPPRVAETHRGDFNAMARNLNTCIAAVEALVVDTKALSAAAVAGQLSVRADAGKHQGDLGRIKDSVNATAVALHDAVAQVAEAAEQVSGASQQIATSSQAVASGATEQASALQETTGAIAAMASITKVALDNSERANGLAQAAGSAASGGAEAVEALQGSMARIRTSAEGTSQIIRDINDIAFQTNLLALNAAVEAARAGDAGRGFAVVAEEVRSLALRAKEASSRTEALIRQSVKEANEGEATAKLTSTRLGEIVGRIGQVTGIMGEITAASREQANGIAQVNAAVGEMDKVTQQNAASAEESSSAASELNAQAEELAAMVGGFRIERAGKVIAARAPAGQGAALKVARLPAPRPAARSAPKAASFPMDDEAELRSF